MFVLGVDIGYSNLKLAIGQSGSEPKTIMHISEHSDHPFRDYTIADFAIIRSPIPRFSGHF